jgi:hypothetical protein
MIYHTIDQREGDTMLGVVTDIDTLRNEEVAVQVMPGLYTNEHFRLRHFTGTAHISFKPGCWMRWLKDDQQNALDAASHNAEVDFHGNGLVVEGYGATSANGLSAFKTTVRGYDISFLGSSDGMSAHEVGGRIEAYGCFVHRATRYAVVHVNGATSLQQDCTFSVANGASDIARIETGLHEFKRCSFYPSPDGTVDRIKASPDVTFTDCDFGNVVITGNPIMNNCTGSYVLQ